MLNWLSAQVTISPTSIFVNSNEPFGTLLVLNGTDKSQEVTVSFPFGYPRSDDNGQIIMEYSDPDMADKFSIEDMVSGFPRTFVLGPNKRQVVRLTVRPSKISDPGTYWTRIKTESVEISPEVGAAQEDGITADIKFVFEQITTLFYQSGELTTGLNITDLRTVLKDNTVKLIADFSKTGNSPYLGTFEAKIIDSSGKATGSNKVFVSIYTDGARNLVIDTEGLASGEYTAEVKFFSSRLDVPDQYNVITEPVIKQVHFNY